MSRVRFLLDENQSPRLRAALFRLAPTLDVLRVGDPPTPALGTPDVELLRYLEVTGRILVTSDRTTMPGHIQMHLAGRWTSLGHLLGAFGRIGRASGRNVAPGLGGYRSKRVDRPGRLDSLLAEPALDRSA